MNQILLCLFTLSLLFTPIIICQQTYTGNAVLDCNGEDAAGPSSEFLYTCNGRNHVCRTFLIFKSQPPFNSVPTISALMFSNQDDLAEINNVTRLAVFPTNKEVIVPVNCSCSGWYYRARTKFHITEGQNTFLTIANDTFQGLTSCNSLKLVNPSVEFGLEEGNELEVPLRCACPTRSQTGNGTRYLLTYSVSLEDTIRKISERFNVTKESIFEANGFSEGNLNPTIFPFTTVLVPLKAEPSSTQTRIADQESTYLPPPSPISPVSLGKKSSKKLFLGLGITISCFILFMAVTSSLFLSNKKNSGLNSRRPDDRRRKFVLPADLQVEIASLEEVLRVFRFEELKQATKNFSCQTIIKGSVYRGKFGKELLAVKKATRDISKEVNILKKTNHFNLIQLRGFCQAINGCSSFLVFEYMNNGSLRDWLHGKNSKKIKAWNHRIQLALDVANGLHYLHSFTKPAYVHGNMNSSNVLLNGEFRGKIGNFSLAHPANSEMSSGSTKTQHFGEKGYVAPECEDTWYVTPKVDVYAFGVIMLELITGKDAVILQDGKEVLLSEAVSSVSIRSLIDPRLENGGEGLAVKMVKLSLTCLAKEPSQRPAMEEIVPTLLINQVNFLKSSASKSSLTRSITSRKR